MTGLWISTKIMLKIPTAPPERHNMKELEDQIESLLYQRKQIVKSHLTGWDFIDTIFDIDKELNALGYDVKSLYSKEEKYV